MKIQKNAQVTLTYGMFDAEGNEVDSSGDEGIEYLHGRGEILEGLEEALEGAEAGQELTVEIGSDQAFGPYDPEGLFLVPRDEFPDEVELTPGEWIEIRVESEGQPEALDARIVEVNETEVVLDANHPLAGKDVTFRVKVLSVTSAS